MVPESGTPAKTDFFSLSILSVSFGWQRQAESSELGDGEFPVRRTIAKAFGLDAATRLPPSVYPS